MSKELIEQAKQLFSDAELNGVRPEYERVLQLAKDAFSEFSFIETYGNTPFADHVGVGWWELMYHMCSTLKPIMATAPDCKIRVAQVKEKFGGLRFYYDSIGKGEIWAEVDKIVSAAEDESYRVCEVCGKPGQARYTGWIKTLCDHHSELRDKAMKERGY